MRVHKITNFFSDKSFRRGGILGGQGQRVRPVSSGRPALPVAIQRLTGLMDSLAAIPAAGHWVKKKTNTIHERSKCSSTSPKSSMQMWPWKALSQRRQSMFGVHVDGRWRGIQQTSWRGRKHDRLTPAQDLTQTMDQIQDQFNDLVTSEGSSLKGLMVKSNLNPNAKEFVPEVNTKVSE